MKKLEPASAAALLSALPDWTHDRQRDAITREFEFRDFIQAFSFMTQLAIVAEKRNHHPEWSNTYKRVEVTLTSHAAKGLTRNDIELAQDMDRFAAGITADR